ncbi:HNH endonuclease [Streptomyces globisporus]|nr:HNH endonuclease [Streptomyces globisporus]
MSIGSMARKVLWARSSNLCAFPKCQQELTVNLHDEGSKAMEAAGVPLGEEAHIVSGSKDGPRYDSAYPADKVDSFENLILVCPTHHRLIDKKDGSGFSIETLRRMKAEHEAVQRNQKSSEDKKFEEVEIRTLAMIDVWTNKADLDNWQNLTWKLNAPVPRLKGSDIDRLSEQGEWVLTRNWPARYVVVSGAFGNYGSVLLDTINYIRRYMEELSSENGVWEFYREHKHRILSQKEYDVSLNDFLHKVDMLSELSLELTKAANHVCDAVRFEIDPLFRFDEGVLPHRVGDGILTNSLSREEYTETERAGKLYPGLEKVEHRVLEQGGSSR